MIELSDQPFVIVAGFVATEKKWLNFEGKWRQALRDFGLGEVAHATDIEHSDLLSRSQKDEIFRVLARIAKQNTTAAFSIAIDMDAYHEINDKYAFDEFIGTPHALAARTFAKEIRTWRKTIRGKYELMVFYEKGGEHIGDMKEVFARDRLPDPQPVEKKHPAVQAADLFGWLYAFYLRNRGKIDSIDTIRNKPVVFGGLYKKKDLLALARNTKVPLRKRLGANSHIAFHTAPKRSRKRRVKRAAEAILQS
ncbi:MAG: hypothetical protein ABSC47_05050 [Terracidiphilus sp.]|jgi:hypothetical protein